MSLVSAAPSLHSGLITYDFKYHLEFTIVSLDAYKLFSKIAISLANFYTRE